jgi:hypothetical protein
VIAVTKPTSGLLRQRGIFKSELFKGRDLPDDVIKPMLDWHASDTRSNIHEPPTKQVSVMNNKPTRVIHKKDVHALFIWCGDSINVLENGMSIQVYADETPVEIESDYVLVYPDESNVIVNVRSNDVALLKAYVAEMFPHLFDVGHPVVDGEVFDAWTAFVDARGAAVINNDPTSDTTVNNPLVQ